MQDRPKNRGSAVIIVAIIGALFGWIYGGNLLGFVGKKFGEEWVHRLDAIDKVLFYLAYGLTFIALMPILNFFSFLALVASQWARRAVSWGRYIGCLIHGHMLFTTNSSKWKFLKLDYWIDRLIFGGGAKVSNIRLRSCLALSVIGAYGGAALALGFYAAYWFMNGIAPWTIFLLPIAMSAMGVIYWACIELSGIMHGQHEGGRNKGWAYSEIVFGAYLFLATLLLAIN